MAPAAVPKFLDTGSMPWREFEEAPGVSYRVLTRHPSTPRGGNFAKREVPRGDGPGAGPGGNGATLMLRFGPGTSYPAHRHPEGEEYYVLEGDLTDGPRTYGAGTYVKHPPGSVHAPRSGPGAVLLVFVPGGIELVGGAVR